MLELSLIALAAVLAFWAAGHALLNKRDPRAALGWIVVSLFVPLLGPGFYYALGINRIRTRARRLVERVSDEELPQVVVPEPDVVSAVAVEFSELDRIARTVSGNELFAGNEVTVLNNGEEAFPAMLEAIDSAEKRVVLATYIFDTDTTGRRFIEALAAARERAVEVRVLIDGVGELYSWPRAAKMLRKRGVAAERFLPPRLLPPTFRLNLRNHRKILVVDGHDAFTGGMNIGDRYLVAGRDDRRRVADSHFHLTGPVVGEIERTFLEDWRFVTGELLAPSPAGAEAAGSADCRLLTDGPNEDLDKLSMVLIGALSAARSRVAIMTPYFVPPRAVVSALQAAALRGVEVTVVLPEKNNLPYMHWASRNMLWELLEHGVRIYYQPLPFVHSKLFLLDDHYVQIGSANLDSRSLRLNFEMSVEIYSEPFGRRVAAHFERVCGRSREVSLEQLDSRSLPVRLRDSLAWLFSPYL